MDSGVENGKGESWVSSIFHSILPFVLFTRRLDADQRVAYSATPSRGERGREKGERENLHPLSQSPLLFPLLLLPLSINNTVCFVQDGIILKAKP